MSRLYRVKRESCDGFPAEFFGSRWSEWRPLLFGKRRDVWFESSPMRDVTRQSALYELAVTDSDGTRTVVYLGSTGNLRRRMFAYRWRGSHISPLLYDALDKGLRVDARWMYVAQHKTFERIALLRFDYLWNASLNGTLRHHELRDTEAVR